jgi:predicted branched-subunit amino acid permease
VPPPPRPATDPARAQIVRDGIGVGVATGTYGISFGALGIAAGLDLWQTCALSLLMFTGASQFAFVGVLASGGALLSGAVTAVLLGVRNALYAMKLTGALGYRGWRRAAAAHLVLDESTAMAVTRETPEQARTGFLATGLSVFVCWNLATLVGALAGQGIGDPRDFGLDAAVGAAFLALLWPRLRRPVDRVVAVLAVALALGLVPLAPAGVPVLAAAFVALAVGAGTRGRTS